MQVPNDIWYCVGVLPLISNSPSCQVVAPYGTDNGYDATNDSVRQGTRPMSADGAYTPASPSAVSHFTPRLFEATIILSDIMALDFRKTTVRELGGGRGWNHVGSRMSGQYRGHADSWDF